MLHKQSQLGGGQRGVVAPRHQLRARVPAVACGAEEGTGRTRERHKVRRNEAGPGNTLNRLRWCMVVQQIHGEQQVWPARPASRRPQPARPAIPPPAPALPPTRPPPPSHLRRRPAGRRGRRWRSRSRSGCPPSPAGDPAAAPAAAMRMSRQGGRGRQEGSGRTLPGVQLPSSTPGQTLCFMKEGRKKYRRKKERKKKEERRKNEGGKQQAPDLLDVQLHKGRQVSRGAPRPLQHLAVRGGAVAGCTTQAGRWAGEGAGCQLTWLPRQQRHRHASFFLLCRATPAWAELPSMHAVHAVPPWQACRTRGGGCQVGGPVLVAAAVQIASIQHACKGRRVWVGWGWRMGMCG